MIQLQENFNFFELQKKGGTGGFKGRGMKQWHSVNLQVPSTTLFYPYPVLPGLTRPYPALPGLTRWKKDSSVMVTEVLENFDFQNIVIEILRNFYELVRTKKLFWKLSLFIKLSEKNFSISSKTGKTG